MKKRMRLFFWTLLLLTEYLNSYSQNICLSAGRTLVPGTYAGVRYEHYTNGNLNLCGGLFLESSNRNDLRYRVYGLDLLAQYASSRGNESLFAYRLGFGTTGHVENEPWIYHDIPFSKKLNYGLVGEAVGEWWMSEHFCLCLFTQQKYLFNSLLGNTRFAFGTGLKFHFDSN